MHQDSHLANTVRLALLALEAVVLILEMLVEDRWTASLLNLGKAFLVSEILVSKCSVPKDKRLTT